MQGGRHDVTMWVSRVRTAVNLGAAGLVLIFGYLTIKDLPYADLVNNISSNVLIKTAAVCWFFCWVWGNNHDLTMQERILSQASNSGKVRGADYFVIFLIIFSGYAIYLNMDNEKILSIAITLFISINIFGWLYHKRVILSAIEKSEIEFKQKSNRYELVLLQHLHHYHFGWWQIGRFLVMLALLLAYDVDIWIYPFNDHFAHLIHGYDADVSFEALSNSLSAMLFATLIFVGEFLIWVQRFKMDLLWSTFAELRPHYRLVTRPKSSGAK